MTPHGPDALAFVGASSAQLAPQYFEEGLAFMLETPFMLKVARAALAGEALQRDYQKCWHALPKLFDPAQPAPAIAWEQVREEVRKKVEASQKS
eukprot:gene41719-50919_t